MSLDPLSLLWIRMLVASILTKGRKSGRPSTAEKGLVLLQLWMGRAGGEEEGPGPLGGQGDCDSGSGTPGSWLWDLLLSHCLT